MSHDYKCWHKALSKELCEYMDCFESNPDVETLCIVEKLSKTMVKLYEMEAYEIMFDCLEDCFGYDRDEHEFEDKDGGGMDYVMFSIYNAYNPARMTRGTPHYPSTTGREYGTGVDHRYGEYTGTDRSMMPYGTGWGMMNAADGRGMNGRNGTNGNGGYRGDNGMGGRTGDNGSRGASYQNHYYPDDPSYGDWDDDEYGEKYRRGNWMNADRGGRRGERGGRRERDSRGRYMNMAERKETKERIKKLSDSERKEWLENLENEDGTTGPMWDKNETTAIGKKLGVKFDEFSEDAWNLAMNLLYSDYCVAIEKSGPNVNKPETFGRLAKAFMEDSDGPDGEEKLALYFKNIVEADDD